MSNSLDPDQARRSVWPNLGPNCLQRLSADGPSRQRVNLNKGDQALLSKTSGVFFSFFLSPQIIYRGDPIGYLKGN